MAAEEIDDRVAHTKLAALLVAPVVTRKGAACPDFGKPRGEIAHHAAISVAGVDIKEVDGAVREACRGLDRVGLNGLHHVGDRTDIGPKDVEELASGQI